MQHLQNRSWWAVAVLVSVFVLALAGCAREDEDEGATVEQLVRNADRFDYTVGKRGGALTLATISDPLTFNLAVANDASTSGVLGYLFEGLTETSWLTDGVEPALAESWEHSEDGLTWTFNLRRDVKWHNGQPFTAHDVDFTFNKVIYIDDIPASSRPAFTFRYMEGGRVDAREDDRHGAGRLHGLLWNSRCHSRRSCAPWARRSIRSTSSNSTWTTAPLPRRGTSRPIRRRSSARVPSPSVSMRRTSVWC